MLKNWIVYYLFLLVSLAFALLYPGGVSSAFFYALLVLPPVSLAISGLTFSRLRYEQSINRLTATKGDKVTYRLTVNNRSMMMLPFLEVSFYGVGLSHLPGNEFSARRLAVPPFNKNTCVIDIPCKYKGLYDIGVMQMKSKDYLGLFSFKQNINKLGELVIFPRIVPIRSFPVAAGHFGEATAASGTSHEKSMNVSDIRKYASGDRLRAVHWKLTAKKDELMVRNFEQASGAGADIFLDTSGISGKALSSIELEDRLVEYTVAIAYYFVTNSVTSELYCFSSCLIRQNLHSIKDFNLAYRMLSELSFCKGSSTQELSALSLGNEVLRTIVVITANLTEELCNEALKLGAGGRKVIILHALTAENCEIDDVCRAMQASLINAGATVLTIESAEDINTALAGRAIG
jgi:uncharacterized protein (DUF58 family)